MADIFFWGLVAWVVIGVTIVLVLTCPPDGTFLWWYEMLFLVAMWPILLVWGSLERRTPDTDREGET